LRAFQMGQKHVAIVTEVGLRYALLLAPRAPELSLHRRVQKRKTSKMCNTRATPCERKRCLIQAAAAVMPDLTAS